MEIRKMTIDDYSRVKELWMTIHGFAIRSIDDSYEGVERFLTRNPDTSVVAIEDDRIVIVDYKTDRVLRNTLKKETSGITTFIVAQRIGTIKDADRIIVLDEGRIAGTGTHEELMKNCRIYREIAFTQLSQEELA